MIYTLHTREGIHREGMIVIVELDLICVALRLCFGISFLTAFLWQSEEVVCKSRSRYMHIGLEGVWFSSKVDVS
jgi:hypothetical protein